MSTIDLPTLHSIRRMLRAGVRHAEIARRLDLAVGTISRIASVRRLRRRKLHLLTAEELPEDDPPPEYQAANLRRCPDCGGLAYQWPCLACRLRSAQAAGIVLPDEEDEGESGGAGERETLPSDARLPFSPSPPLPLSPSFPFAETPHVHA